MEYHIELLISNLVHGKYLIIKLKISNYGSKHIYNSIEGISYISISFALNFNCLKFSLQSIRKSFFCKLLNVLWEKGILSIDLCEKGD